MNINVYIEDPLAEKITQAADAFGISRNSIIREALKDWLLHHKANKWPQSVQEFKGNQSFPSFESHRSELTPPDI